jgi:hypothetical protein
VDLNTKVKKVLNGADLGVFVLSATLFTIPSSGSFVGHYMIQPNWPNYTGCYG